MEKGKKKKLLVNLDVQQGTRAAGALSVRESRSARGVSAEVLFYYQTNKRRVSSFVQRQKY